MQLSQLQQFSYALGVSIFHTLWQGFFLGLFFYAVMVVAPKTKAHISYICANLLILLVFLLFVVNILYHIPLNFSGDIAELHELPIIVLDKSNQYFGLTLWERNMDLALNFIYNHSIWIGLAWGIGVVASCCRLFFGLSYLRKLEKYHAMDISEELENHFKQLLARVGISKPILLRLSARINSPMTFGWLKPIVLLPVSMLTTLSADQIEFLLLHELAHIKRNDFIINVIKSLAKTFVFFHPVVWWAEAIIEREREKACDDLVLSVNKKPLIYIRALASVAEAKTELIFSALPAIGNRNDLSSRIQRIINYSKIDNMKKNQHNRSKIFGGALGIFLLLTIIGIGMASTHRATQMVSGKTAKTIGTPAKKEKSIEFNSLVILKEDPNDTTKKKISQKNKKEVVKILDTLSTDKMNNVTSNPTEPVKPEVNLTFKNDLIVDNNIYVKELGTKPIDTPSSPALTIVSNRQGTHSNPLIEINGEIIGNFDIGSIEPANIESVSVFKGETAVNMYGEEGRNGVIQITTKNNISIKSLVPNATSMDKATTIYPNPAKNLESTIDVSMDASGLLVIELFDNDGTKIETITNSNYSKGKHQILLNASSLNKGTYIIKINRNGSVNNQRIIIE